MIRCRVWCTSEGKAEMQSRNGRVERRSCARVMASSSGEAEIVALPTAQDDNALHMAGCPRATVVQHNNSCQKRIVVLRGRVDDERSRVPGDAG